MKFFSGLTLPLFRPLWCVVKDHDWQVDPTTLPAPTRDGLQYWWRCRRCGHSQWFNMHEPPTRRV